MGDELLLITESAAIVPSANDHLNSQTNYYLCKTKLVECRICQDEDEDSRMEVPCSCCGTLKYAHRRCVQRWCNEKGNTVCEICHQQFKPGYTATPPLFHLGGIPTHLTGSWEIGRTDLNYPRIMTMVSTDHNFLHRNHDASANPTSRSLMYCCSIAIIFMVLLVLRHTLPALVSGTENNTFPLFMLLILRCLGIILPMYIILTALNTRKRRRRQQQVANASFSLSDEEAGMATTLHQSHIIHSH